MSEEREMAELVWKDSWLNLMSKSFDLLSDARREGAASGEVAALMIREGLKSHGHELRDDGSLIAIWDLMFNRGRA